MIQQDYKCIAVYNSDKKELIALFSSIKILNKYLVKDGITLEQYRAAIYYAINNKKLLSKEKCRFDFNIALRFANQEQITFLEGDTHILFDETLPEVTFNMLMGFHSNRERLHKEQPATTLSHSHIEANKNKKGINNIFSFKSDKNYLT